MTIRSSRLCIDQNLDSIVTHEKLDKLKSKYRFPPNVEVRIARPGEKVDVPNDDWVCLYTFIFKFGFRFSITKFVKEILIYYDLAPAQLMLNAWRILLRMEVLPKKLGIEFLV